MPRKKRPASYANVWSEDRSKDTNAPLKNDRRRRLSSIDTILFQEDDSKSKASSKESDAIIFNSRWKLPGTVPTNDDATDDHYDKRFSVKTLRTFSVIEPLTSPLYSHYRSCEDVRKLRRYSMPVEVQCHSPKQQASKSCDDLLEGIYDNLHEVLRQQEIFESIDQYDDPQNFNISHSEGQYDVPSITNSSEGLDDTSQDGQYSNHSQGQYDNPYLNQYAYQAQYENHSDGQYDNPHAQYAYSEQLENHSHGQYDKPEQYEYHAQFENHSQGQYDKPEQYEYHTQFENHSHGQYDNQSQEYQPEIEKYSPRKCDNQTQEQYHEYDYHPQFENHSQGEYDDPLKYIHPPKYDDLPKSDSVAQYDDPTQYSYNAQYVNHSEGLYDNPLEWQSDSNDLDENPKDIANDLPEYPKVNVYEEDGTCRQLIPPEGSQVLNCEP